MGEEGRTLAESDEEVDGWVYSAEDGVEEGEDGVVGGGGEVGEGGAEGEGV